MQETRARGQTLAEVSFFFRLRHLNTCVVSDGSATLLVLSHDDYQQLCATYVEDASKAIDVIITLVQDGGKAGKSQGSRGSSGAHNEAVSSRHACPARTTGSCGAQGLCCGATTRCVRAAIEGADATEAAKIRQTVSSAVKRQNQQLVCTFLQAAADDNKSAVDAMLDAGSLEVDDADYDARTVCIPSLCCLNVPKE